MKKLVIGLTIFVLLYTPLTVIGPKRVVAEQSEKELSEEDLELLEFLDLLENYEFLQEDEDLAFINEYETLEELEEIGEDHE